MKECDVVVNKTIVMMFLVMCINDKDEISTRNFISGFRINPEDDIEDYTMESEPIRIFHFNALDFVYRATTKCGCLKREDINTLIKNGKFSYEDIQLILL